MTMRGMFAVTIAVIALLMPSSVKSQDVDPLQPFERLIGGRWYLDESYQEFEWGVGRQSVRAWSYLVVDDSRLEWKLMSELSDRTEAMMSGTYVRTNLPQ